MEDRKLSAFLSALAGPDPTPGGGGAAALMGALGAALSAMVCHLTLGKKGYAEAEGEMRAVLDEAERLRARLTAMVGEDATVFAQVMAAYRLPRDTEREREERGLAIQQALRAATEVPLACAGAAAEVMRLCRRIAGIGNRNVISDAGVAVLAAYAALRSAALNVYVNLGSLQDREFAADAERRLGEALSGSDELLEEVYAAVRERL